MSDETTVVSEPVATPETTSAPSTPETTSAPETTTEHQPLTRNEGEHTMEFLKRAREDREKRAAAETGTTPKLELVKPAEPVKPGEEAKPEEKKEPEPAAGDPDAIADDDLEPEQGMATSELAEKLKADPALAASLEAAGLKNQMFANARLADKAKAFVEEFPGGIEDAKHAKEQAVQLYQLDDAASSIQDVDTAKTFLSGLLPLSYILDADGNPLQNADGSYQTDGTVDRLIVNTTRYAISQHPGEVFSTVMEQPGAHQFLLNELKSLAPGGDDEELNAALEIIQERFEKRGSSAATSEPVSAREQQLSAKEAALKAEENRLNQQRQTAESQRVNDIERAVATDISTRTERLVESILGKFAIPQFNRDSAKTKIIDALYDRIDKDSVFKSQANQLARKQYGEKVHQARVGEALRAAKKYIVAVAQPIIKEAGGELIGKQGAKLDKINTQAEATRKLEPKGASVPVLGNPAPTGTDLMQVARENLKKRGVDSPDAKMLLDERRRLLAGQ